MIWWAEQPGRAQSERNAIGDLAERSSWLVGVEMRLVGTQLAFDCDIEIGERRIPLTLVYPDFFPDAAPSILARDRELLSGHQYGPSGELCLEHRPDNWTRDVTGAMMIESAHRLLSSEDETGQPAPADHRVTRAQRMRHSAFRFLFSRDTLSGLGLLAEGEVAEGEMQEQDVAGTYVAQLSRIGPADGPLWREAKKRGGDVRSFRAVVVRVPAGVGRASQNLDELKALLWAHGHSALATDLKDGSDLVGVLLFDGKRIHVPMVFGEPGARKLINYDAIFAEPNGIRLDPAYERLKASKVAIVGCGSVGSKVAVQLARSGVGSFVLIDGDVLSAGNLVRNELDWRSVGVHKAPALGARLKEVNADCTFTARTNPLGGQESGAMAAATMAAIETCDLIVDATADPGVFNLCSAIARRAEKPMCWGQVFAGGGGGIVVRLRPGIDPAPLTARQRIEVWYAQQGVDWPEDGSAKPYEDAGADGAPLIADDADVGVIASHLSRFAIDLLARPGATVFPYPAYVIGLSDRWLFTAPFDVRPIDLGESDAWGVEPGSGDIDALKELLADLTAKKSDEG
ncbi:ThiF family adenylyltransferase [Sphingomonas lycopersici]|uniref:ThiF family adenylyltransferase n=1 Tax=Sphingomonas lycopersici TaxID=2951807 RepID=A0AA42CWC0_9SPHN|nr:ThiF family adenylyltransferase [Sphingomonas lycopersici]MCW6537651.1 ThiF family adenylyltransferase [Sphingomonas lycopersici]